MHRFHLFAPGCLRACAVLLSLLCARAHAQALPNSVTIAGSFQSELGCAADWDAACALTHLELNPVDGVWRKVFTVPEGPQEFKATINDSWEENYGAHAERGGANLSFSHEAPTEVKFFYDPVTHWVTNSTLTPIAVLAGSLQDELGCAADWDPACMLTWLKDIDGDGVQELVVPSLPAGSYELKVAHHESWNENYGVDGEFNGPNIPFTVPAPGQEIRFRYDTSTHRLVIQVAAPTTTTLSVIPNPTEAGEDVTLTATVVVTDSSVVPVGSVMFKENGEELGTVGLGPDGTAALTSFSMPAGTYSLTAEYGGRYEPSVSEPVVLQVSEVDGGTGDTDAGTDGGTGDTDAGTDGGSGDTDAGTDGGTGDVDAGSDGGTGDTDGGSGDADAGTDGGIGDVDAGPAPDSGTDVDAGTGDMDAGSGNVDAGTGDVDAGTGDTDAGTGDTDAGTGDIDAGTGDTDAGTGDMDAGMNTDAGTDADAGTDTDAGSNDTDAGTSDEDAGTGDTDAGTNTDAGTGSTDAGTTAPQPTEGDDASGCGCGASSGGAPMLLLGMWMTLTTLQSRRRRSGARAGR